MAMLECKNCGHSEEANKEFFLKIIGGSFVGGGAWAWTAYLFAGTGFAFVICAAIITGGIALLAFADEITKWLSEKYPCPSCNKREWKLIK